MSATASVAIKIKPEISERVRRLAEARHSTSQGLMSEAIYQYVEREEKREAFQKEAMDAWEECQNTGLHVTADEVIAWLDTWGDENEKSAPVCHI